MELGFTILEMKSFPDHYNYSDDDLNSIYNLFLHQKNQNPKLRLVTTSKDAIKFLHHPIHTNLDVIDYQIKILDNIEGSLLEKISHCL